MVVFASVYAIFAAVDGVALGIMVRRWVEAEAELQGLLYETAFAVRQIEAGLFSLQWFLFGVAAACFATAFFTRSRTIYQSSWVSSMAWLSALASAGTLAFAITQARTGFSATSMAYQVGLYPGVLWILGVGVFLYWDPVSESAAKSPLAR